MNIILIYEEEVRFELTERSHAQRKCIFENSYNNFISFFLQIIKGSLNCIHLHRSNSVSYPFTSKYPPSCSTQKSGV